MIKLQTGHNDLFDKMQGWEGFYTASHTTSTTSPKTITDKLDHQQTRCKDKQTRCQDEQTSLFPNLPDRTDCF